MRLREIIGRLKAWSRRDELDRALAADLQAHVELLARDLEHDGLPPDEALRTARVQVGNLTGLRERSRSFWGFPPIEAVLQDLRYALRGLGRSPGFTAAVTITLALGIGANAAMFGVIDRLMLRPTPLMREPGDVNRVYIETTYSGRRNANNTFPFTRYLDLKGATSSFSQVAAMSEWRVAVGSGDQARVRKLAGVSASFFEFFDAPPERGRYFFAAEDEPPLGAMVAVISHALWTSAFAGEDVVGRTVKVGTLDYTIIGVAPPGFVDTCRAERRTCSCPSRRLPPTSTGRTAQRTSVTTGGTGPTCWCAASRGSAKWRPPRT